MPHSFRELRIWQDSSKLMLELYSATSDFPKDELFSLTSQIRRASILVMANIAEGHDRATHLDRIRFFIISRGSIEEIRSHLSAAQSLGYLGEARFSIIDEHCSLLARGINAFIKSLKAQSKS